MKKTAAILLLALLLFNTIGYRIIFNLLEQKATARLENKIEAGKYAEEQLVEIKIPLSMPYYSDKDYESVYGETDWNGKHYRYVKRKISGNTLYLLCLPHEEKNQIVTVENEMAKAAVDNSTNAPGPQKQLPSFVKLLNSVFEKSSNDFLLAQLSLLNQSWIITDISINNPYTPQTPAQPPEHSGNC